MNTVDVLRRAKEILSDETRWERGGQYYRGPDGYSCDQKDAVTFCLAGAVGQAAGFDPTDNSKPWTDHPALEAVWQQVREQALAKGASWVQSWNDDVATHAELIDAFDRAILSLAPETKPEPTREQVTA